MSPRFRNRGIAVAVVLGGLILPLPAAAGPSRAEQGWDLVWSELFTWLGFGTGERGGLLTDWSSSYIDPLGGQVPNAVAPEDPEPFSPVDSNGEDR
ncbi:MAG TPA: hypothetical protein VEP28_02865 [Rubrobacter sp.]|nr:hypothetical protein [Rubrobacter sp.]